MSTLDALDEELAKAYTRTLLTNPFRELRVQAGLTQPEIAAEMEVTTQYIYRHERGLINSPSWQLAHLLLNHSNETGLTEYQVLDDFYGWVKDMRSIVRSCITDGGESLFNGPLYHVGWYKSVGTALHPFDQFMFNFNAIVATKLRGGGNLRSRQLFYRFVCVHPRAVQLWLGNKLKHMPHTLRDALEEVGISYSVIHKLEDLK